MYEARQYKNDAGGKVSRQIDSGGAQQRVKMRDGKKYIFPNDVMQRKLYMGSIALLDPAIIQDIIEKKINFLPKPKNMEDFCLRLHSTYGGDNKNMTIERVVDIINSLYPNKPIIEIDISEVIANLNAINPEVINSEIRKNRIRADTRLSSQESISYLSDKNKKEEVKKIRQQWYEKNMNEADTELKKGDYFKEQYKNEDIFRTGSDYQDSLFDDDDEELSTLVSNLFNKLFNMHKQLMASWYFNQADEDTILNSGELRSRALLPGNGKTMSSDVNNKTNDYFFFFIEHQDSPVNIYTRFIWPTPPEKTNGDILRNSPALTDGTGRRIRIPLTKIAKAFPIIMGGDLSNDRQEADLSKLGLPQNITPQKLISSYRDDKYYLVTILNKFATFVVNRIFKKKSMKGADYKEYVDNLNRLDGKSLIEYINRYIANPQLMVPRKVSFGMKGITMESSPKSG